MCRISEAMTCLFRGVALGPMALMTLLVKLGSYLEDEGVDMAAAAAPAAVAVL